MSAPSARGHALVELTVRRPGGQGERTILDRVTAELLGPVDVITGPSGAGKTTLLRLLNELDAPSAGTVSCDGRPLADWSPLELRRHVGFVAQQPAALADTGWAELALAAELAGRPLDRAAAEADLEALGLPLGHLEQDPRALSVGERQRLALVRALVACPRVLLLDEPTSAQDEPRAERIHQRLATRVAEGLRLVIVEHRTAALRAHPADTVVRWTLSDGALVRR